MQTLLLLLHLLGIYSYSTNLRPTSMIHSRMQSTSTTLAAAMKQRFTTKPLGPGDAPPQGRESPQAPDTFNQRYTFGFNSDYYCAGRIMDEPRKMRLTCTKNPNRKMNCQCNDQQGNSLEVKCRCGPAFTATKKHINLIDAFVGN